MLTTKLQSNNILVEQGAEDADTLIAATALRLRLIKNCHYLQRYRCFSYSYRLIISMTGNDFP